MKQLIREHRGMLVLLLFFAVMAVAVWLYLLIFQQQQREVLHRQWTEKRNQLHDQGNSNNPVTYQQHQAALNKLLATVPARNELPRLLGQITDYAAMRKATIETLSYKPTPSAVNLLQGYTLVISAKGGYDALKLLLADLQDLAALAYTESVSLVNPDPQGDQLLLEIRMVLNLRSEGTP